MTAGAANPDTPADRVGVFRRRRTAPASTRRRPPRHCTPDDETWGCGGRCPPQRQRAAGATAPPTRRHEGGDRPRQGFAPGRAETVPPRLFVAVLARRSWAALFAALLRAKPGPRAAGETPDRCSIFEE
jgi:hypothetical protein